MAPCNGTQQWHHVHSPKVGRHPPLAPPQHTTMAPCNGTTSTPPKLVVTLPRPPQPQYTTMEPYDGTQQWHHVHCTLQWHPGATSNPPKWFVALPPIGSKNPYSYRYLGNKGQHHEKYEKLSKQSRNKQTMKNYRKLWKTMGQLWKTTKKTMGELDKLTQKKHIVVLVCLPWFTIAAQEFHRFIPVPGIPAGFTCHMVSHRSCIPWLSMSASCWHPDSFANLELLLSFQQYAGLRDWEFRCLDQKMLKLDSTLSK